MELTAQDREEIIKSLREKTSKKPRAVNTVRSERVREDSPSKRDNKVANRISSSIFDVKDTIRANSGTTEGNQHLHLPVSLDPSSLDESQANLSFSQLSSSKLMTNRLENMKLTDDSFSSKGNIASSGTGNFDFRLSPVL